MGIKKRPKSQLFSPHTQRQGHLQNYIQNAKILSQINFCRMNYKIPNQRPIVSKSQTQKILEFSMKFFDGCDKSEI